MADDSILTPGITKDPIKDVLIQDSPQALIKDNYLSEFTTEEEKSVARENLGVYPKDSVYTKQETTQNLHSAINAAINNYLNQDDPHNLLPIMEDMLQGKIKDDGSTPFKAPQVGVDPTLDTHLTTRKFVSKLLRDHVNADDPHQLLPEVQNLLKQYVQSSDTYLKTQVYNKGEINELVNQYVKKDGSTAFTKAQIGVDPVIDSHLSTKRYVDKTIYSHLSDIDPHGFITILNNRLSKYAKKNDFYDKTQTYSRTQIDSIVINLVNSAIESSMSDYIDSINDKLEYIRKQNYVKQDGSVAFLNPQKGVDAIDPNDLVTLRQLHEKLQELADKTATTFDPNQLLWKTSGPVESTVGHVEDNTPLPEVMTLQEILDAIFYGKGISLEAPDSAIINTTCDITMCIHGSLALVGYVELYQNDQVILVLKGEDFEEGCITTKSLPISKDTEFTFKVYYSNGSAHEDTKTVYCVLPIFVGLLPKWKFGNTITMEYLEELEKEDTEGTQNRFIAKKETIQGFSFKYQFKDSQLKHPFIVIPSSYPDLEAMITKSQSFSSEAFDIIDMIPLRISGSTGDIIYKIYIYRQALSSLNQEVTFNFKSE